VGATVVARLKTTAFAQGASNSYLQLADLQPKHRRGGDFGAKRKAESEKNCRTNPLLPLPTFNDGKYHIVASDLVKMPAGNAINVYLDENPTPVMSSAGLGSKSDGFPGTGMGFGDASNSGTETIYYDGWRVPTPAPLHPAEEVKLRRQSRPG